MKAIFRNTDIYKEMQKKLNLQDDFVKKLKEEDDWSYVIKIHTLIEAALTYKITQHINDKRLNKHIEKLNMNGRSSKLSIAKDLKILPSEFTQYISELSGIRNHFAHSVSGTQSTIFSYYEKLNQNDKTNFINKIGFISEDLKPKYNGEKSQKDLFLKDPRHLINVGAIAIFTVLVS